MILLQLRANFGKLHGTLTLHEGLNELCLPNEAGKSTWSAFLLAMLYGIDTRERATRENQNLPAKERYRPWDGSSMEGAIDLIWNGRAITIERRSQGRTPMGAFRAYETESGTPVPELTAENCGRTLCGAERSVFERTAFVRQLGMAVSSDAQLEQRLSAHNPADGCALPKAERKEMQTLPVEQLTSFLREAKDSGVFALYYIDLTTGLRRGELLGLKWSDIDLEKGDLRVQRQIGRIDGKIIEMPLKTKNAYRTLPLSADAISVLMQQRRKTGNSEWVFPSPTGGPMSPDSVLHMLQRVLKRAGLPRIRFHDLRHTFATMALQNGVDVKTVSSMLGHYSAGFTLDTYAHVTTDAQLKAAQTMGNILSRAV